MPMIAYNSSMQQAGEVPKVKVPRLRELRHRAFISQAELASRSGVSEQTIIRLEAGKTGAYFSTIRKLAEALGVKPEELVKPRRVTRIQFATDASDKPFFREYWIHEWDEELRHNNEHITDIDQAIERAVQLGETEDVAELQRIKRDSATF